MGVVVSPQEFVSATPSSSHYSPPPAWAFHRQQFLQSISTCSDVGSSRGYRELSALASGVPPPSLTLVSAGFLTLFFFTPHCLCTIFCPFLNLCSQRHRHLGCWVQLCPAVGPLEPAGTGCVQHGAAPTSPHRGHPAAPPLPTPGHLHEIQPFSFLLRI